MTYQDSLKRSWQSYRSLTNKTEIEAYLNTKRATTSIAITESQRDTQSRFTLLWLQERRSQAKYGNTLTRVPVAKVGGACRLRAERGGAYDAYSAVLKRNLNTRVAGWEFINTRIGLEYIKFEQMASFSGALKLSDLDDFITPSQVSFPLFGVTRVV